MVCVVREGGSLSGRVGDFGLGLTKPVPDESSIGGGLDDVVLVVVVVVVVVVAFLGFAEELAAELAGLVGSFALGGFAIKGDRWVLLAVFAVETGAIVFEVDFTLLVVLLGALAVGVVEGLPFRASPIPPLRTVPPKRAADESVGLPGSILV